MKEPQMYLLRIVFVALAVAAGMSCSYLILLKYVRDPNPRVVSFMEGVEQSKILVVGTSHFYHGIDPDELPMPTSLIGLSDMDFKGLVRAAEAWIDRLPSIETLILELAPEPLQVDVTKFNPAAYGQLHDFGLTWLHASDEYLENISIFFEDALWPLYRFRLPPFDIFDRLLDKKVGLESASTYNKENVRLHRGFEIDGQSMASERLQKLSAEFVRRISDAQTEEGLRRNQEALKQVLNLRRSHPHLRILLLSTPRYPEYLKLQPHDWQNVLDEAVRELNGVLQFSDFRQTVMPDQAFIDPVHLSAKGAKIFSMQIRDLIVQAAPIR